MFLPKWAVQFRSHEIDFGDLKMTNRKSALAVAAPMILAAPLAAVPRGICGTVRGERDPAALFADLRSAVEAHNTRQNSRMDTIEAAVNSALLNNAGSQFGLAGSSMPDDPEYSSAFASYFRNGAADAERELREANASGQRQTIHAAMSVGTNSDGGYIAPEEWDRRIRQRLRSTTPMRSIAQVQATSSGAFTTLWSSDEFGSGWVGETAVRPQTTGASLAQLTFEAGEIFAQPAATQRLMDDAEINIEAWLAESVEREFSRQEGIAFISGDGVNKPRGLLTYVAGGASDGEHPGGNLEVFNSESATDIPGADTLLTFKYSLAAPYRQNARWLMNSQTAAAIAKMKDGDGNYVWREGLIADEPATLLGRPVTIDEGMPNIAADALPIAFGDFQAGYLINDRVGTRVLRDPYTNKPFVRFYTTKRVGGGVLDPHAIKLLKIAVSA